MYWRIFEGFLLYEVANQSHVVSAERTIDRKKSKFTGNILSEEEEKNLKKGHIRSRKKSHSFLTKLGIIIIDKF
jgi:hypothetical protein